LQLQHRTAAPGDHPGQAGFRLPGISGRPCAIGLQALDSDRCGLLASGTGEDVVKQAVDDIYRGSLHTND